MNNFFIYYLHVTGSMYSQSCGIASISESLHDSNYSTIQVCVHIINTLPKANSPYLTLFAVFFCVYNVGTFGWFAVFYKDR